MNFPSSLRIGVVLIALAAPAHVYAQAVVNTLSKPPSSTQTPVTKPMPLPLTEYDPTTPPAANVPIVVSEKQDEIAARLAVLPGETNDQYTKRMKVRYDAAMKELERLSAEHDARMKALVRP